MEAWSREWGSSARRDAVELDVRSVFSSLRGDSVRLTAKDESSSSSCGARQVSWAGGDAETRGEEKRTSWFPPKLSLLLGFTSRSLTFPAGVFLRRMTALPSSSSPALAPSVDCERERREEEDPDGLTPLDLFLMNVAGSSEAIRAVSSCKSSSAADSVRPSQQTPLRNPPFLPSLTPLSVLIIMKRLLVKPDPLVGWGHCQTSRGRGSRRDRVAREGAPAAHLSFRKFSSS